MIDKSLLALDNYYNAVALALLADLLFDKNGNIPEKYKLASKAHKWALEKAQYQHAWVVCSPSAEAMDMVKREIEKLNLVMRQE